MTVQIGDRVRIRGDVETAISPPFHQITTPEANARILEPYVGLIGYVEAFSADGVARLRIERGVPLPDGHRDGHIGWRVEDLDRAPLPDLSTRERIEAWLDA